LFIVTKNAKMNYIATHEIARTDQNQKDEWRRFAPPLIFLVLCPKQNLHCYSSPVSFVDFFCLWKDTPKGCPSTNHLGLLYSYSQSSQGLKTQERVTTLHAITLSWVLVQAV